MIYGRRSYRLSCAGKQPHASIGKARAHIRSLERRGVSFGPLNAYWCPHCKHYHVGHDRKAGAV